MRSAGLWMLLVLGTATVVTGLPVWALLIAVASAFAAFGLALGAFDAPVLSALPTRLINLLDHDLLQAMPLYVFIGVLLQRTAIGDALFDCAARALRITRAAPSLAGLAVGALVAPMNGSVASSSALLARLVAPRLKGLASAKALALVSAGATVGLVVPPSLVLILLGDAMMRAHTEASNLPGYTLGSQRIVNTQDVLRAALVPALSMLVLWSVVAWAQGRRGAMTRASPVSAKAWLTAGVTALAILVLLAGVFTGHLFAVEAAATGGCLLAIHTAVTRALDRAQWSAVLMDTLDLSGALFALLAGATTFSLVFRLFGTDRWIAEAVLSSPLSATATALLVLAATAVCGWVLDAFEMIFVIVPIVAPLLVMQLADAQQVSVLLLLVLQAGFLLPPMGYAVLMARAQSGLPPARMRELAPALAPYVMALLVVMAMVFVSPRAVHWLDEAPREASAAKPAVSEEDLVRQMREMSTPPADDASAAEPATQ
ncbi:MAG TPA: TRAP transporter large permease subunit [Ramlibacter sp.]|uniref:TRAP transporter large permease subunit n=1 Tax=Ramlibacter sp. TaxID=1917967 RepID=UPI002CC65994|nr:TRAP transporter large permease subunit [Ramlibacter sp.]HVZ43760.1 TRAP transporter large permease subunit [Ramlibacter sp.]